MKRIKFVFSLLVAVFALGIQAQVNPETAPVMTFEKTVHDWGTINEGDIVETDFVFTNTGKTDLIITRIKGSCGCTVPSNWKKEPIKPGETSKFHVKFNSRGKPNKQQKTVTVTCNTIKGKEYVRIKATVTPNPEQEKLRAERTAQRKLLYEKRKAEQARLKAEREANNPNNKDVVAKKIETKENKNIKAYEKQTEKELKRAKQERKRVEKERIMSDKDRKKAEKKAEKERKRAEKEIKREEKARKQAEKDRKRAEKRAKKERKRAEKARKAAEKERKKIEKMAKKKEKLRDKVKKAEAKVAKYENKLLKMQSKFKKLESRGKLSPNDITKRQLEMQKQEDKIQKAKMKLQKAQRKL